MQELVVHRPHEARMEIPGMWDLNKEARAALGRGGEVCWRKQGSEGGRRVHRHQCICGESGGSLWGVAWGTETKSQHGETPSGSAEPA